MILTLLQKKRYDKITGGPQSGKHLYWLDTLMAVLTHGRPLPGTPLATRAEASGRLRGAGQVGAVRFVSHSSLGISAADITRPLPLAAGHWALEDMRIKVQFKENVCIMWFTNSIPLPLLQNYDEVEGDCLENAPQSTVFKCLCQDIVQSEIGKLQLCSIWNYPTASCLVYMVQNGCKKNKK